MHRARVLDQVVELRRLLRRGPVIRDVAHQAVLEDGQQVSLHVSYASLLVLERAKLSGLNLYMLYIFENSF